MLIDALIWDAKSLASILKKKNPWFNNMEQFFLLQGHFLPQACWRLALNLFGENT